MAIVLLLCFIPLTAAWGGMNDMIGDGEWIVRKLSKCPDDDKYTTKVEISRRKVNRTHDGFNFYGNFDFTLDNSRGKLYHQSEVSQCTYTNCFAADWTIINSLKRRNVTKQFVRLMVFIDACKYMDGGCKPYQTFADDCACCFFKKYAESNMREILTMAGLDHPDCPVPKGEMIITDYVFDYATLPAKGIYGTYDATVYILDSKVGNEPPERLLCMILTVDFDKISDDED